MTTNQIAEKAAEKVHWAHVKKPDAYAQEDIARTRTIIQAAIEEDRGEMWNTIDCQRREIERLRELVKKHEHQTATKRPISEYRGFLKGKIEGNQPDDTKRLDVLEEVWSRGCLSAMNVGKLKHNTLRQTVDDYAAMKTRKK